MFQGLGGAKSEPRICAAGLNTPYQQPTATSSFLLKVKRQIRLQAKSNAKSGNREKSSKVAFEPDETGSPELELSPLGE
jgi:hypothetical protein